jgi:hypothetical protein
VYIAVWAIFVASVYYQHEEEQRWQRIMEERLLEWERRLQEMRQRGSGLVVLEMVYHVLKVVDHSVSKLLMISSGDGGDRDRFVLAATVAIAILVIMTVRWAYNKWRRI